MLDNSSRTSGLQPNARVQANGRICRVHRRDLARKKRPHPSLQPFHVAIGCMSCGRMEVMRTATKAALILQPDRSTYKLNERQVVPCGLLVPSRDRSKALEVVEENFDHVASSVEGASETMFLLPLGLGVDDRLHAIVAHGLDKLVRDASWCARTTEPSTIEPVSSIRCKIRRWPCATRAAFRKQIWCRSICSTGTACTAALLATASSLAPSNRRRADFILAPHHPTPTNV